jgi:hypothetical protein
MVQNEVNSKPSAKFATNSGQCQRNPTPTSSSLKSIMIDWLSDRGIPISD